MDIVENATNAVKLEGPVEIIDVANSLCEALKKEFTCIVSTYDDEDAKYKDKMTLALAGKNYYRMRDARPMIKNNFLQVAREVF